MEKNNGLSCFVLGLLAFTTSTAIAQLSPNDNNGQAPPFSTIRGTLITTGMGIGLGHKVPMADTTDENGIIVEPHPDATKPFIWGYRWSGQQGNGVQHVFENLPPAVVESLSGVKYLSGGAYHLIAITLDGKVWGWGQTGYGESGCKHGGYQLTPCRVLFGNDPTAKATYVDSGEYHTVLLTEKGEVYTWGAGTLGRLGNGLNTDTHIPQRVNLNGEKAHTAGAAYEGGFAVTNDHVWAWGDNEFNGLGVQNPRWALTPVIVPNLDKYAKDIVYIGGGNGWAQALLKDGTVIGWGVLAALGQDTTSYNTTIVPVVVTTNIDHMHSRYVGTTALTRDGKVVTWGHINIGHPHIYGTSPTVRPTVPNDKVIAVGGGKHSVYYRTESGRLFGVGYNDLYKLDQSTCCGPDVQWPGVQILAHP